MTSEAEDQQLPQYQALDLNYGPPEYTPSLHHTSLVYYSDESRCNGKTAFVPLLFEINSTQINFYHLKDEYSKYVAYLFNDLHPTFVDPNLNIKSKNPSKMNIVGGGIGSSTSLFSVPDASGNSSSVFLSSLQPTSPPPLLTSAAHCSSTSSLSTMFSLNSGNSSMNNSAASSISSSASSSYNTGSIYTPAFARNFSNSSTTKTSFTKFFDKLSLKKSKIDSPLTYHMVSLTDAEKKSQDLIYVQKLMNYKPDINSIMDTDYSPQEAQMLNFKSTLFKSFSLQELVKFGNASDFHSKPFTLRLIFPTEQFVMVSYNVNLYGSIFYKLNVAKEISLDIDLRIPFPTDYCVPRRSRGRRTRGRHRSSTAGSTSSMNSTATTSTNANANTNSAANGNAVSRTTTRSRSNSLLDDGDEEDEFDTTFNIDCQPHLDYQPHHSIQPQIILEDEILNDIIQLEPAQQVLSSLSCVSRVTTSSVFSSVERYSSQATDMTMMSSLSPISSENEEETSSLHSADLELPHLEKSPPEDTAQSTYKELVFAIKCIRSCKNKTLPWLR